MGTNFWIRLETFIMRIKIIVVSKFSAWRTFQMSNSPQ